MVKITLRFYQEYTAGVLEYSWLHAYLAYLLLYYVNYDPLTESNAIVFKNIASDAH